MHEGRERVKTTEYYVHLTVAAANRGTTAVMTLKKKMETVIASTT